MNLPYIIAETACSHDGSVNRLKKIIDAVIKANFDAIQIQVWRYQNMVSPDHKDVSLLKKIQINYKEWAEIISYIRKKNNKLDIIACIYDEEALDFCLKNKIKLFKIHTADLGNKHLIKKTSSFARRIDLSIGSSSEKEIKQAISWINKKCDYWLMYGYQLFPTNPLKLNLKYAKNLSKKFSAPVGYQDHSFYDESGYTVPTTAIGLGIDIIEKHVTDKNSRNGTDGSSAIEIKDYKKFITKCNESKISLGDGNRKKFSKDELKYRKYSKKKILYSLDLKKNHKLKFEDLIFLRTEKKGIMLNEYPNVIGKKLKKDIKVFDTVHFKNLK